MTVGELCDRLTGVSSDMPIVVQIASGDGVSTFELSTRTDEATVGPRGEPAIVLYGDWIRDE